MRGLIFTVSSFLMLASDFAIARETSKQQCEIQLASSSFRRQSNDEATDLAQYQQYLFSKLSANMKMMAESKSQKEANDGLYHVSVVMNELMDLATQQMLALVLNNQLPENSKAMIQHSIFLLNKVFVEKLGVPSDVFDALLSIKLNAFLSTTPSEQIGFIWPPEVPQVAKPETLDEPAEKGPLGFYLPGAGAQADAGANSTGGAIGFHLPGVNTWTSPDEVVIKIPMGFDLGNDFADVEADDQYASEIKVDFERALFYISNAGDQGMAPIGAH